MKRRAGDAGIDADGSVDQRAGRDARRVARDILAHALDDGDIEMLAGLPSMDLGPGGADVRQARGLADGSDPGALGANDMAAAAVRASDGLDVAGIVVGPTMKRLGGRDRWYKQGDQFHWRDFAVNMIVPNVWSGSTEAGNPLYVIPRGISSTTRLAAACRLTSCDIRGTWTMPTGLNQVTGLSTIRWALVWQDGDIAAYNMQKIWRFSGGFDALSMRNTDHGAEYRILGEGSVTIGDSIPLAGITTPPPTANIDVTVRFPKDIVQRWRADDAAGTFPTYGHLNFMAVNHNIPAVGPSFAGNIRVNFTDLGIEHVMGVQEM